MTNEEPTVQVPVSLIERLELAADVSNIRDSDAAREARALLRQPTADSPQVEDMAPGTTFTADGVHRAVRMMRTDGDVVVAVDTSATRYYVGDLDQSTIRDVTPPKEA